SREGEILSLDSESLMWVRRLLAASLDCDHFVIMRCDRRKRIPSPSASVGRGEIEENRALLELARQLQAQVWGCNHAGFGKRLVQSFPSSAVEQREVATPFHTAISAILLEGRHGHRQVVLRRADRYAVYAPTLIPPWRFEGTSS